MNGQSFFATAEERHAAFFSELDLQEGAGETLGLMGRWAEDQKDDVAAEHFCTRALALFQALDSPYTDLAVQDLERVRRRGQV